MKILWIGDGGAPTGFGIVSHEILSRLAKEHEVHHLAINYNGDPINVPWKMYPAFTMNSAAYGHERLPGLLAQIKPDVVCILADSWVVKTYEPYLKGAKTVAYIPVDGENQWSGVKLNWLKAAIAYTRYGAFELRKGGFQQPVHVVPHGIDLEKWKPERKEFARGVVGFKGDDMDAFIIGCVNRNQTRKRLDLLLFAFQRLLELTNWDPRVRLLLHCAIIDEGWELMDLSAYLGIDDRIVFTGTKDLTNTALMSNQNRMRSIYNALDAHVSTAEGEGWGLTAMESMACDVPTVLPYHSAFAEWAKGGAKFYSAPGLTVKTHGINTFRHVPDVEELANLLHDLFLHGTDSVPRGRDLVSRPEFRWENVAAQFDAIFREVVG